MSLHAKALHQQLVTYISQRQHEICFPCFFPRTSKTCMTMKSYMDWLHGLSYHEAALVAFSVLPFYQILANAVTHEIISMLSPVDRILLSHTCRYLRHTIISVRCLSDLWLYIYHIPSSLSMRSSAGNNSNRMLINNNGDPSPSHANTSLPNTRASTMIASRAHSIRSMFRSKNGSSSSSSASSELSHFALHRPRHGGNKSGSFLLTKKLNKPGAILTTSSDVDDEDEDEDEDEDDDDDEDDSDSDSEDDELEGNNNNESYAVPLLTKPNTPIITNRIIYWPNYKQVLYCDFPLHWKRKNSFYYNLNIYTKYCGGAHIRVSEIGLERLPQILTRISPMLLSLCFLNILSFSLDVDILAHQKRLLYLGYQYLSKESLIFIPSNIVALEFTSCNFAHAFYKTAQTKKRRSNLEDSDMNMDTMDTNTNAKMSGTGDSSPLLAHCSSKYVLPNVKFLRISNCKFSNYALSDLFQTCDEIIHLSISDSIWINGEVIQLPSKIHSLIWKQNDGAFDLLHCTELWQVSLTIADTEMIEALQTKHSLQQLIIATPLFKDIEFLDDTETFFFTTPKKRTTPTPMAMASPSMTKIYPKPKSCHNHQSPEMFAFNDHNYNHNHRISGSNSYDISPPSSLLPLTPTPVIYHNSNFSHCAEIDILAPLKLPDKLMAVSASTRSVDADAAVAKSVSSMSLRSTSLDSSDEDDEDGDEYNARDSIVANNDSTTATATTTTTAYKASATTRTPKPTATTAGTTLPTLTTTTTASRRVFSPQQITNNNQLICVDGNDRYDDTDNKLRIICYHRLLENKWFTDKFVGDHIEFVGQTTTSNPYLLHEFSKLNSIFVRELKITTNMFLMPFPFY